MTEKPRLIERAFPLKQASLDSVHEKNVRRGDISTVQIAPARPGYPPRGRVCAHITQILGPTTRVTREGVMPCR